MAVNDTGSHENTGYFISTLPHQTKYMQSVAKRMQRVA